MSGTCEICSGAIPDDEEVDGHTALCAEVASRRECTLENCGHMRQLDAIVDLLGMTRGTRSVLDELRARIRDGRLT
jgi:hypothetical protein